MTAFIALRQASRRDASELAILADIASHGFASWLWFADVANGVTDTPLELGRLKMSDEEATGGWRDAAIAEAYGEVAGVAIGHVLDEAIEGVEATIAATEPMLALQKTVVGSWFIGSLGVYRHLRGIGIGRRLLEDQIDRADRRPVCLITASDNEAALSLYGRNGFSEAARADAVPLFENSKRHAWVLMTRSAA
ncbi:putative acetyltransferase protein [Rhizobium etli CFN 42]|uniref:Acetyltransferase protein n=1 Tax=Rhizobium etli (strain ATCC 51251 / DSM 11541 / JCM 21823 / NBRC 15573 / CFN 42) TaxID=347834 RepID=Q2K8W3_RHIEC|nr:GNAT family N-acetyltransferase [Rhizobium etli]ABC90723.1 putative acetyltransferase protein [Rhizobium etli CFN 42]